MSATKRLLEHQLEASVAMVQARKTSPAVSEAIEQVLVSGDLSRLSPADRVSYYNAVCESVGINPLTRPFDYIMLSGKLTLYARKDCTDQLRTHRRVSIALPSKERVDDVYVVTARATMPDGRHDEATGAVNLAGLKGENLANALMKAETKAKRRVTLSICGLGFSDESEVDTIPGATVIHPTTPSRPEPPHDELTGEVVEPATEFVTDRARHEKAIADAATLADLAVAWRGVNMSVKAATLRLEDGPELLKLKDARKSAIQAAEQAAKDKAVDDLGDMAPGWGAESDVRVVEMQSGTVVRTDWSKAPREPGEEG